MDNDINNPSTEMLDCLFKNERKFIVLVNHSSQLFNRLTQHVIVRVVFKSESDCYRYLRWELLPYGLDENPNKDTWMSRCITSNGTEQPPLQYDTDFNMLIQKVVLTSVNLFKQNNAIGRKVSTTTNLDGNIFFPNQFNL